MERLEVADVPYSSWECALTGVRPRNWCTATVKSKLSVSTARRGTRDFAFSFIFFLNYITAKIKCKTVLKSINWYYFCTLQNQVSRNLIELKSVTHFWLCKQSFCTNFNSVRFWLIQMYRLLHTLESDRFHWWNN